MQMLFIKSIRYISVLWLVLSVFTNTSFAETSFNGYFQVEPVIDENIANRITVYYSGEISLPLEQQKIELIEIDKKLNFLSNQYSDQAVYWFITGLNHRNMASYYFEVKKPVKSDYYLNNKNVAYKKAMELDKTGLKKLSASVYNTMKHGLPVNLKIQAIQEEISLGGSGDSDSSYWYLHWSNIDQLSKAGRGDEARQAYKNMLKEMKNINEDMSVYQSLNQTIEKKTISESTNATKMKQLKQDKKSGKKIDDRSAKKHVPTKPADKKLIIISSIVVVSIVSLIFLIFYEIQTKKRK